MNYRQPVGVGLLLVGTFVLMIAGVWPIIPVALPVPSPGIVVGAIGAACVIGSVYLLTVDDRSAPPDAR